MGITDRPYAGTWKPGFGGLVQYTPDCIVYLNGDVSLPGCGGCARRINFQEFIVQVSVDASNEPGGHQASLSMSIPRHIGQSWFHDGVNIIQVGLEVHIYMRGYFPVRGLNPDMNDLAGVDASQLPEYPYYHAFHGVLISVDTAYSGGFYTVSASCASMLHFWNYIDISTNASLFGSRPRNSQLQTSLRGHNFTGMSPYAIIYSLYQNGTGAAAGVGSALQEESNLASLAVGDTSLFSLNARYWEERFNHRMYNLRMHGATGQLFSSVQQAYLSRLSDSQINTIVSVNFSQQEAERKMANDPFLQTASDLGFLRRDSSGKIIGALDVIQQEIESEEEGGGMGINVAAMEAFVNDISAWGDVNFFESTYQSKLDIAAEVARITGFEFYQDVDGDLVFKPPLYNLDTRPSRVYRIDPIDVISITFSEAEPEATYMIVKNGAFQNMTGTGLEGEWGVRGNYVDYRLVAQFGWRKADMETNYYNNPRAAFYAAVAQLDITNAKVMNTATITIPGRPELRTGYPVYISGIDAYYYIDSFNHAFQFGGSFQTTLVCSARRGKFHAPGNGEDGIGSIDLRDTTRPPKALQTLDGEGHPRVVGFPNVVMALDPEQINPLFFYVGSDIEALVNEDGEVQTVTIQNLINQALLLGVIHTADGANSQEGPWVITTGENSEISISGEEFTFRQLSRGAQLIEQAQVEAIEAQSEARSENRDITEEEAVELRAAQGLEGQILQAMISEVRQSLIERGDIQEPETTHNILGLLSDKKASFSADTPGSYRYYSSSHPDPEMQGMRELHSDVRTGVQVRNLFDVQRGTLVPKQFKEVTGTVPRGINATNYVEFKENGVVSAGLNILKLDAQEAGRIIGTHEIKTLSFSKHTTTAGTSFVFLDSNPFSFAVNSNALASAINRRMTAQFDPGEIDPDVTASEFLDPYIESLNEEELSFLGFSFLEPLVSEIHRIRAENISSAGDVLSEITTTTHTWKNLTIQEIADLQGTELQDASLQIIKIQSSLLANWVTSFYDVKFAPANAQTSGSPLREATEEEDADNNAFPPPSITLDEFNQIVGDYRNDCLALTDTFVGALPSTQLYFQDTFTDVSYQTPVFPVSDENGYDHIGSYAYGRGLRIEPGANYEQLMNLDPLRFASPSALDAYVEARLSVSRNDSDSESTRNLEAINDAEVALIDSLIAGGVSEPGLDILESYYNQTGEASDRTTMLRIGLQNFIASERDSVHKLPVSNAAFSLADIVPDGIEGDTCPCRGAEADLFLEAFATGTDSLFLSVEDPVDAITGWMRGQMEAISETWKIRQDALRGTVSSQEADPLRPGSFNFGEINFDVSDIRDRVQTALDNALEDLDTAIDETNLLFDEFNDITDDI